VADQETKGRSLKASEGRGRWPGSTVVYVVYPLIHAFFGTPEIKASTLSANP